MARYVPVVVVLDEDDLAALRQVQARAIAQIESHPRVMDACRRNGWTAEGLAFGTILAAYPGLMADLEPEGP
jgi:hypothetical protein